LPFSILGLQLNASTFIIFLPLCYDYSLFSAEVEKHVYADSF